MALTPEIKKKVRYHLGYLQVQPAASIQFGIARPIQTLFLVETAMDNIIPNAEEIVIRLVGVLDGIEQKLLEALDRLAAIQLGDLKLRENETDKLEEEYVRWAGRLADTLGVPFYSYSNRFRAGGVNAGSIPVR